MRTLVVIPHYFAPRDGGRHGSLSDAAATRVRGLGAAIAGLKRFVGRAYLLGLRSEVTHPVEQSHHSEVDILICTTGNCHLLADLPPGTGNYEHRETDVDPRVLGHECRRALRDRFGAYDYYGYLEDDLIVHDLSFFAKLAWFTRFAGNDCLLQPNRYEENAGSKLQKLYIDGELPGTATLPFQDVSDRAELVGDVLGRPVTFRRASNPHAGCYFLNADQFAHWAAQPFFDDAVHQFIGPLETAATLGIMRAFRVYKALAPDMAFLELEHSGSKILSSVERESVRLAGATGF